MKILAHRANWNGGNRNVENTTSSIRYCLERGWGIETDIRRAPAGCYYISHDLCEMNNENCADSFLGLFQQFPDAVIALNIKELGYEADLILYLSHHMVLPQVFLFDMELLEHSPGQTAELFRQLSGDIKLAARVSDRGETIERALRVEVAEILWLDEFDSLWVTEKVIKQLKSAGKKIYAISPEIHGFSLNDMKDRWCDFYNWGVDGICTDYSERLDKELATNFSDKYLGQ